MIHLDVETYSECDLKASGLYAYAEHPTTDVLCVAYFLDIPRMTGVSGRTHVWRRGEPPPYPLFTALRNGFRVKAHNCAFDAEIWRRVLQTRYGWWWPGYDAFVDSMAQAQITNLPGSLDMAAKFFGSAEKNKRGYKLMLRMCKPANLTKNLVDEKRTHTPENLTQLANYCVEDVRAERGFSSLVPELSPFEERVWSSTWSMNRRGVCIDVPLVMRCKELAEAVQARYRDELSQATDGDVTTETQRQKLGAFLEEQGAVLPRTDKGNLSFSKDTRDLIDLSKADLPALEALEIYDTLNKSSISKFDKMLSCLCTDGRIRGMFAYSGAGQTGRWAGRDVQLQNLPRGILEGEKAYADARALVMDGCDADEIARVYGDPMSLIASLIRVCLIPEVGKKFVCADYSAIEGRTLAWLAGEKHILDAYASGKRMYALAASAIFGVPYEEIYDDETGKKLDKFKDLTGKIAELACGYQGSYGAFMQMGGKSLGLDKDRILEIVRAWRQDHKQTTKFWAMMNAAAINATDKQGIKTFCRGFIFGHNGSHLRMQLPSKRCLWYRKARLGEKKWADGGTTPQVEYFGVEQNRVGWIKTYGGKLVENATQAVSRDLLADAMLRGDEAGWPFVMTVHDELVAEVPEDHPGEDALCELMRHTPAWAKGLPVDAAGWSGRFYRKD